MIKHWDISNESEYLVDVFFDDLKVEHVKSPIIATSDYYSFGSFQLSYQRQNTTPQDLQRGGIAG